MYSVSFFPSSFGISTLEEVAGFIGLSLGFLVSSLFIFFSILKSCLGPTKSSLFSELEFSTVTFDSFNILFSSLFSTLFKPLEPPLPPVFSPIFEPALLPEFPPLLEPPLLPELPLPLEPPLLPRLPPLPEPLLLSVLPVFFAVFDEPCEELSVLIPLPTS